MTFDIPGEQRRALLETARESIASRLAGREPSWPAGAEAATRACGAFVTLREAGRLRGCIGRMTAAEPLFETVRAMARSAAFDDPRFPPLSARELSEIDIEITALSPLREIADVAEIEVGRHGVHATVGWRSAVFLPQVAVEQGWDRDRLLAELCAKAGLPPDAWRRTDAVLQVFEGVVFGELDG